jgi:phosphoribosylformimino-5-aminoimidazole carboxamide ribotide isomerase
MLIVPAIDIYGGRCVRLLQGAFSRSTRYAEDPVTVASRFSDEGARVIHIVDLDAAEGKGADNRVVIARIRAAVSARLEVGGGVRTEDDARALKEIGIQRIVVGTPLARAPEAVGSWATRLGGCLVGGIDARDGRVRVSGWTEDASLVDTELAAHASTLGLAGLVYTNISRDGMLEGPDIMRTLRVAEAADLPTLLSGGIGAEEHVERAFAHPRLRGVIIGKAIYEGTVKLADLIRRFDTDPSLTW